ncbi:putative ribonuclease H-like domain-containing protein [Tanacetum coccineum]
MDLETAQTNTTVKLPLLKQENGNSFKPAAQTTTNANGSSTTLIPGPVTADEKTQKKNDDAKTVFAAIQTRFCGNDAIKKTQRTLLNQMYENFSAPSTESLNSIFNRLQKIVSQLAILGENISQEDLNLKFLRSLPSEWNTHVVFWRNKPDLDTMSFDDLYNNFKIVEQEVKGTASLSSNSSSQNLAFVSSTSSTNEVNTAYGVSTANLSDDTVYAFLASQPNGSHLVHEDLKQIHEDDLEKMDLKWQLALPSMRTRKFFQKTGRKITINRSDTAGYDKSKVECFNCHKLRHFARECRGPRNQDNRSKNQDSSRRTINVEEISSKAMLAIDGAGFDWSFMADEEVPTDMALMAFSDSEVHNDKTCSKTCLKSFKTLKTQLDDLRIEFNKSEFNLATYKRGLASVEEQLVFYKKNEVLFCEQLAVLKRDISYKDSEISMRKKKFQQPEFEGYGPKTSKVKESPDAPLVEELVLNDKKKTVFPTVAKIHFVRPQQQEKPVRKPANCNYHQRERMVSENNYTRVNYNYSDKKAHPNAYKNIVPRAVLMKTGLRPLNTARPVNTAHPKTTVYSARPMSHFSKSAQSTGHLQKEDQGYVNSGCSRYMTGNMFYLSDFKEFNGGYVTFGGGAKGGKIAGKRTLKTGKLDFEDVYFVKELQFNLFSVSQMCDKKNSVLFTNTGCFVLSPDFKLADESHVLLKVPRKSNMSTVDIKNIIPKESLTCLVAKATLDELMLWHRRLGKFDGKSDEGFFVRYSLNSKAFRVYNTRTRKVEENLHIRFLEDKPIIAVQTLMNSVELFTILICFFLKNTSNDEPQPSSDAGKKDDEGVSQESRIDDQERPENSTQDVNTAGPSINTASTNVNTGSLNINTVSPTVTTAPLEATHADFFGDETELDMSNITTTYLVPTTPNTRIHKDHSLDHVISDVQSGVQTKRMTKTSNEQGFISVVYEGKTHEDLHTCLFACFLSQVEPKKKVWTLVDLPYGKRAIGTKWVYKNKKDKRSIVIRNKVEKALYGLHQAPRAWYETLSTYLLDNGFQRGRIDKTLFIKRVKCDILLVHVYVDDIIFASTRNEMCTEFENMMHKKFQMSSMGELTFFLGLQTTSTPMETSKPLLKDAEAEDFDSHLKYLKGQPKLGLWYPKDSPFDLEAYTDSDYAGASLDRKYITGGCKFIGRRLISWQCKKQTIVANSTTEAEYVAAASCCGQVLWIQNQMLDYGYNIMNTKIHIDNESTICIVKNPMFYSKTKHIEIRHHFIRDSNEKKLIQMIKIHTDHNVANLLTKAFDVGRFQYLIASIGMLNP